MVQLFFTASTSPHKKRQKRLLSRLIVEPQTGSAAAGRTVNNEPFGGGNDRGIERSADKAEIPLGINRPFRVSAATAIADNAGFSFFLFYLLVPLLLSDRHVGSGQSTNTGKKK